jgi:hypothetical protein
MKFDEWLADLLGQSKDDVRILLKDPTALHFLMAWSLFESKCFAGFVKIGVLEQFADRLVTESYRYGEISTIAASFHGRYQDDEHYRHLMHGQPSARMEKILASEFDTLEPRDVIFVVLLVTYRFRNNIFHGNKRVRTWLRYKEQIAHCTAAMQSIVSHAEALHPTMRELQAA